MLAIDVGLDIRNDDKLELLVADLSLARALYEGVPAARMLARLRLAMDERDARSTSPDAAVQHPSFELLVRRCTGGNRTAHDRVMRAVARHSRVAAGEGSLAAPASTAAALVYAIALGEDLDASLSEVFSDATEPRINLSHAREVGHYAKTVAEACAAYDERIGGRDPRASMFEACVRLATQSVVGPLAAARLFEAARILYRSELGVSLLRLAPAPLLPRSIETETPRELRTMARLDRSELDAFVTRDQREIAAAVSRVERQRSEKQQAEGPPSIRLDSLIADLANLFAHSGALVLAIAREEPDPEVPSAPPPSQRPSWAPSDWTAPDAALSLADAIEKGITTGPAITAFVERGGEPALDAIGAEMLSAAAHPFASAAFADILAASGRPRDVIRLVTYFAVAPDPTDAARTLSTCEAPELPSVLKAWLEAMLPSDGGAVAFKDETHTSSGGRVTMCIASLKPYPKLYSAVCPLLDRVSDRPDRGP